VLYIIHIAHIRYFFYDQNLYSLYYVINLGYTSISLPKLIVGISNYRRYDSWQEAQVLEIIGATKRGMKCKSRCKLGQIISVHAPDLVPLTGKSVS